VLPPVEHEREHPDEHQYVLVVPQPELRELPS
jgi:hypothetical protein